MHTYYNNNNLKEKNIYNYIYLNTTKFINLNMYVYIMVFTKEAQPWIRTTVLISPHFYRLAKKWHIMFSEAMRVGLSLLLADRGEFEYDNKLNLYRKMRFFQTQAEKASQEALEAQEKLMEKEGMKIEKKGEKKNV